MNLKLILTVLFVGVASAVRPLPHDDLIVAVGDYLEVFSNKSGYTRLLLNDYHDSIPAGLGYDPSSQKLYFSDYSHENVHIFSTSINETNLESVHYIQNILNKHENQSVENLSFDSIDSSLFWVDVDHNSIKRMGMKDNMNNLTENPRGEVVHFLDEDHPRGLVTDPCTRMLYWSNWKPKHPTIERSYINGSHREIIVKDDLSMPHGLALDAKEQKLYWVSNGKRFNSYHIERSNVDGSERELIYTGTKQYLFYLTVSEDYIYWTDWEDFGLWSLRKDGSDNQPTLLRRYNDRPMAVILFQHQPLNCDVIPQETHREAAPFIYVLQPTSKKETTTIDNANSVAYAYEKVSESPESQTTVYTMNPCKGYCFNGGRCNQVQMKLTCKCREQFTGVRCETKVSSSSGAAVEAAATTSDDTVSWAMHNISALSEMKRQLSTALICIAVTCGALVVVVVVLSIRVHQLSRRPRLKRRFFGPSVKPGKAGKLNSSPEPVMDIENCCNMNICETPCTEPPSRTPRTDRGDRHGDGQKLLGGCQF